MKLREEAPALDGTAVIEREVFAPEFDADRDYSAAPVGAPVRDGGQVYKLLQPHHAAHYPGRPADLPALWSVCHTKDPAKAKPWAAPQGTSGMYQAGECYIDAAGQVWRQIYDGGNVYDAAAMPERWERA